MQYFLLYKLVQNAVMVASQIRKIATFLSHKRKTRGTMWFHRITMSFLMLLPAIVPNS